MSAVQNKKGETMSPSKIRTATLKQMRAARKSMMSMRWILQLEGKNASTKTLAAKELLRVHHAIQKLENQQLANIRKKLIKNETDLLQGEKSLSKALKDLKQTEKVLSEVSKFLTVVGRVVKLLA
jgi:septal ring factor EnvC (AmiA/AmiB activator)